MTLTLLKMERARIEAKKRERKTKYNVYWIDGIEVKELLFKNRRVAQAFAMFVGGGCAVL